MGRLSHFNTKNMIYVMRVGTSVKIGFTQNQLTLKTRLKSIRIQNQPQETITFDDAPIIELWPPELTYKNDDGKFIATFTQKYRTFQTTKK